MSLILFSSSHDHRLQELSLLEPALVACAPLAVAAGAVVEAARATLSGNAHEEALSALQQLLDAPLDRLRSVIDALRAHYAQTVGCGEDHPAFATHHKHASRAM